MSRIFTEGSPIVPAIRGLDILVLPKSIQGDSRTSSPKALEVALPSLIIIGLKMFSLAPNLWTQEGMVIRMPKPFPYKDSRCDLWKYDVTLISTRTGKEDVCSNISSGLAGLTRIGRCYTLEELEKGGKRLSRAKLS
ncbi:hypothetical protein SO802_031650 [Lithocarpus litseifolius]|uniref:Uncharacterized protein n=1 Tax=Lithocarpus litseifolius TaxID=425828 RepID=A0AAW2BP64_9ROSI